MSLQLRLRSAAAFVAGVLVVFGVFWADQAFAADSLQITAPQAGSTVTGDVRIEGQVEGSGPVAVTLSLAPQVLGDCGPSAMDRIVTVDAGEPFSVTLATVGLDAGNYCVVALAEGGALSAAVADIAIDPGFVSADDMQLPTLSLPGDASAAGDASAVGLEILIPTALGSVAAVSVVVLSVGLLYRRRQLQDS